MKQQNYRKPFLVPGPPRGPLVLLGLFLLLIGCFDARSQEAKENSEFKLAVGLFKDGMYDLASEQFKNFIGAYPGTANGIEARYYLGLTEMKLKKYDEARITFQNFALAYVDHPKAPEAWFNVGEAFSALHNEREAASAYGRVKVFHPKSVIVPEALLKAADLYRRLGERESARQALRSIIQDYPTSKSVLAARLAIGELYAEEGQMDLAEQEARRVGEGDAPAAVKAAALFSLGKLQVAASLFDGARQTFTSMLTLHKEAPAATEAEFELGKLEAVSGNYPAAIEYFRRVISAKGADDSLHSRALFELAGTYEVQGAHASARKSYEQAAASADSMLAARALLEAARSAWLNNEFDQALLDAEKVQSSRSPILKRKALLIAANSMAGLQRYGEAAKYYDSYADEYPDDPWAPDILMQLADLYSGSQGDFRKAESVLERIVQKYPRWRRVTDAIVRVGQCLENLGDYEGAVKTYRELQAQYRADDHFPEVRKRIEFLKNHKIKNREAGIDELARLMGEVLTDKSPTELALKLGRIYFSNLKDYESAAKQFTTAIAGGISGEQRAEALFTRARSYDLLSDVDSSRTNTAVASYGEFLKEFPASQWTEEAAYRLYLLKQLPKAPMEVIPLARTYLEQHPSSPNRDRALSDLGSAEMASGDTIEAQRLYGSLVAEFPKSEYAGEALVELGKALERTRPDSAAAIWSRAASRTPADGHTVSALWLLANQQSRRNRAADAVQVWKRIVDEFFYTRYAELASSALPPDLVAIGEFDGAISLYTKTLRKAESSPFPGPADMTPLYYLGDVYQKKGDRQHAMKYFSEFLQRDRSSQLAGRAYYSLGILARSQGRMEAASSYFKQAAALGGSVSASRDIADLLYQTEQYAEAAKQYQQLAGSTDTASVKEDYRAKVIFATLRQGKLQEADKLIAAFAKEFGDDHPYRAEFEYERGLACYRKEDYQTARKIFNKVAGDYEETRFGPWGRYYLAKILEVTNKPDDAAKGYADILKKHPESDVIPRVQLSLGNMHFNAERYEDAIRYYQKITASPETAGDILPYALNNLIEAYESTKLYDAAMKSSRDFIERYPNDESILDKKIKIGTLYTKLGYYDQAVLQFQDLIGEAGSLLEAELRYNIGEAYFYKGDYQQAILEFLKVPYLVTRQGKVNWTATSFYMAGQSYEKMSKFDEAVGMYREVVERPGIDATFKAAAKKEIDRVKLIIKKGSQ